MIDDLTFGHLPRPFDVMSFLNLLFKFYCFLRPEFLCMCRIEKNLYFAAYDYKILITDVPIFEDRLVLRNLLKSDFLEHLHVILMWQKLSHIGEKGNVLKRPTQVSNLDFGPLL